MTGFALLAVIAAATLAFLWLMRLRGSLLTLCAAAVAFGCAGYASQGRPGQAGAPRAAVERAAPVPLTGARKALMGQFDNADSWLTISEALASRGNTQDAANILRSAVREHPGDFKLWVGLGNALANHSKSLSPSARYSFDRAQQLAPGHPAPAFFLGLAEARSGNPKEGVRLWREILANAPADASWRPLVEDAVLAIGGR
jgi:cytochrome c-type biogenesis protein CcmH